MGWVRGIHNQLGVVVMVYSHLRHRGMPAPILCGRLSCSGLRYFVPRLVTAHWMRSARGEGPLVAATRGTSALKTLRSHGSDSLAG